MALESLAALSLASNVTQFVDFGCRLFSKSRELYQSSESSATENVELEKIAQFFSRTSKNVTDTLTSPTKLSPEENELVVIANSCEEIADQILQALDRLRIKGSKKKWKCFCVALERIWDSEQIDAMARRMDSCSSALTMCLVRILRYESHFLSTTLY